LDDALMCWATRANLISGTAGIGKNNASFG